MEAACAAVRIVATCSREESFFVGSAICLRRVRKARLMLSMFFSRSVFGFSSLGVALGAGAAGGASWARRAGARERRLSRRAEARMRRVMFWGLLNWMVRNVWPENETGELAEGNRNFEP